MLDFCLECSAVHFVPAVRRSPVFPTAVKSWWSGSLCFFHLTLTQLCGVQLAPLISLHSERQPIVCVCVSLHVCEQWCESWCGQKVSYTMQPFWLTQCVLLSPTYWTGRLHYSQCWHRTNNLSSLSSSSAILQFLHDDRLRVLRKN